MQLRQYPESCSHASSMATDPDMCRIEVWCCYLGVNRPFDGNSHTRDRNAWWNCCTCRPEEDSPSDRRRRLREKEEKLLPHSAVTVTHGHLLIASHRDVLERVLTMSEGDSLATSGDYKRIDAALRSSSLPQLFYGDLGVQAIQSDRLLKC